MRIVYCRLVFVRKCATYLVQTNLLNLRQQRLPQILRAHRLRLFR